MRRKKKNIVINDTVARWPNPSYHYPHANSREWRERVRIHLTGYRNGLTSWPLHMRINFRAGKWLNHDLGLSEREVQKLIPAYTTSLYPAPFTSNFSICNPYTW